ncbi:YczE/YyaS/YitT family protein [Granulicatella seriolae]|uniref:DUF6198 family protein n=1 Tax=Granulicatella seriolae TaxID=2967226 RepID=A0ABT1WNW2_9LACT|nr:DUF6198 family protein [Granulicatella seriolae]
MNKSLRNVLLVVLGLVGVGAGVALSVKADIGMSSYDAFATTLANIVSIKVGTMTIIVNTVCVLIQLLFLRKNFEVRRLLQLVAAFVLGYIINFFLYNILGSFIPDNYIVRLIMFLSGQVLVAVSIALMLAINYVSMPLEPTVMVIADYLKKDFAKLRQALDGILIVIILVLTYIFKTDLTIREGTIIGFIIFAPIMNFFFKRFKSYLLNETKTLS